MEEIGTVACLRRYPVKSMLGESVRGACLTPRGIGADRTHAVLDIASGKVASAKKPSQWRALLSCAARACGGSQQDPSSSPIEIVLPDGRTLEGTDAGVNAALSGILQREVRLIIKAPEGAQIERALPDEVLDLGTARNVGFQVSTLGTGSPPGTFFDYAPIHLVTNVTVQRISAIAGTHIEPLRYRPNIILDAPALPAFVENDWSGCILAIGANVRLQIIVPTPRCAVPTLAHGELPERPDALRVVAKLNRVAIPGKGQHPCVGAYARVLADGYVECGDPVRLQRAPEQS